MPVVAPCVGARRVLRGLTAGIILVIGVLIPIIYGVMGFIGGVIGAAIYNLIAAWMSGIEVEVE